MVDFSQSNEIYPIVHMSVAHIRIRLWRAAAIFMIVYIYPFDCLFIYFYFMRVKHC